MSFSLKVGEGENVVCLPEFRVIHLNQERRHSHVRRVQAESHDLQKMKKVTQESSKSLETYMS